MWNCRQYARALQTSPQPYLFLPGGTCPSVSTTTRSAPPADWMRESHRLRSSLKGPSLGSKRGFSCVNTLSAVIKAPALLLTLFVAHTR